MRTSKQRKRDIEISHKKEFFLFQFHSHNDWIYAIFFTMRIIDTHAHLDKFIYDNSIADIVARAREAGVEKIVACSTSPEEWKLYASCARNFPETIAWQAGIHPTEIKDTDDIALDALSSLFIPSSDTPTPVAIGEIGLDFYHLPKDKDEIEKIKARQYEIFSRQLNIAADLNAKVCVHARNAVRESIDAIEKSNLDFSNVVFHCFAGTPDELKELNERGARASFTGIITYKNADEMREAMKAQPLNLLMFETDCPYLAPAPKRGQICEPAMLKLTVVEAAKILDLDTDYLAKLTTENAKDFFRIQ